MSDAFDLERAADEAPHGPAWIDREGTISFADLARKAKTRGAELIRAGFDQARGDRVLVVPEIDRQSVLTILGLLDLRAPIVLAHPRWTEREIERAVEIAQPRMIVRGDRIELRPPGQRADHEQLIVFTSGTSGTPKGARLSRSALLAAVDAHARALPWQPDDRWLLAMPLAHVGGIGIVLRCLAARRAIVAKELAGDRSITLMSIVPAMLANFSRPPNVRAVLVGGAHCPSTLLERARRDGWPLLPTYGLTECAGQACTQRLGDTQTSGVGPPLEGVDVRAIDGAIEVRGATRMIGFLDQPRLAREDWYRTGDAGRFDARGHLHVFGRLDDRIVSGGENVDPIEVEDALRAHPNVADVCVVGMPDARWGQVVAALLVARGDEPSESSLRDHLDARLARFKHPRAHRFAATLPMAPSGKVDRAAIAIALGARTDR